MWDFEIQDLLVLAEESLEVTVQELDNPRIAKALDNASRRKKTSNPDRRISVRIVVESGYLRESAPIPIPAVGQPAAFRGIAVRQVGYVPVISMHGLDGTGRPLALQVGGEEPGIRENVEITFPTPTTQQVVVIAGHELYLAVSLESLSPQGTPSLQLALLGDDATEPQSLAVLHRSGTVEVGGLQLELDVDYRPLLRVDHRPGTGLVLAGLVVAVIGLAARWLLSPRLLWIAPGTDEQGRILLQVLALPAARGSRWPERLTSRLQEALTGDA